MNKTTYDTKRNQLLLDAQNFLDAGNMEDAKKTREDIEQLDADFHAWATEQANINAMKGIRQPMYIPIGPEGCSFAPDGGLPPDVAGKQQANGEAKIYEMAFAKTLLKQGLNEREAQVFNQFNAGSKSFDPQNATQTVATKAIVVPSTLNPKIWELMEEQHPILADVSRTHVAGDMTLIVESNSGDDGKFIDESKTASADDVGLAQVNLQGCELVKAFTVSWKIRKMGIDEFLLYLSRKIATKMGNALAKSIFSGRGTSPTNAWDKEPRGILPFLKAEAGTPRIVTHDSTSDPLDYTKLTTVMAKLKSGYKTGASFYGNSTTVWETLANIVGKDDKLVFVADPIKGGVGMMFGLPVKEEDGLADGVILLANPNAGYGMNVNEEMSIHYEEHTLARTIDFMGYMIVDGAPTLSEAFVLVEPK